MIAGLASPRACFADDDLTARRQEIANMSLTEQQELLRNQQRFNELTAAEQDRMRKLDTALRADPDHARLQQVLERYHEWLKTLSPEKRAELEELGYDARIQRIQELMARQREDRSRHRPRGGGPPLPKEDQQAIYKWFTDLVWQHRRQLLDGIPEPHREQVERLEEQAQRRALLFTAIQRGRGERFPIEPPDYERLLKELTPETRDQLARTPSPQARQRLARDWIGQAVMAHVGWQAMRRAMVTVSGEELQDFFKKLPDEDRQRLMRMPRDQMQEELKHLYLQRENRSEGAPFDRPSFERPLRDQPPFGHRGPPGQRGGEWHHRPGPADFPRAPHPDERRANDK